MALILIGMPASGKTSLGAALAQRMGWEFIDTDQLIEAQAGRSVRELYLEDAVRFRLLERQVLQNLPRGGKRVIALGGGVVESLPPGQVVYLELSEEHLWERLQQRGLPATLDPKKPRAAFRVMYEERRHHYSRHADLTLKVADDSSLEQLLTYLEDFLQGRRA